MSFSMDGTEASAWLGYMDGFTSQVKTTEYIGSVVSYARSVLADKFEMAMDLAARSAPERYHHVYEWGSSYGSHETVGLPESRLWKLVQSGGGKTQTVGFTFLPSVRPVPIEQALLVPGKRGKTVNEEVHIFTWKATVMEYGLPVTIVPKLAKTLAFVNERTGKLIFTKRTIHTVPGKDDLTGNFTAFYTAWWTSIAPMIFNSDIKPIFERNIKPKDEKGRFRKWTTGEKSRQAGQEASLMIRAYESAKAEGIKDMIAQKIDYEARARGRRMDLYGY